MLSQDADGDRLIWATLAVGGGEAGRAFLGMWASFRWCGAGHHIVLPAGFYGSMELPVDILSDARVW